MGRCRKSYASKSVGKTSRGTCPTTCSYDAHRRVASRSSVKDYDPQQQKVYTWNWQFRALSHGAPMTMGRLHRLVRSISRHFKIPKPRLLFKRLNDPDFLGYADGNIRDPHYNIPLHGRIVFNQDQYSWGPMVVAHEMAHIIMMNYGLHPGRMQAHGKVFAGIMAYIMHKFGIMPNQAVLPSLAYGGVRYKLGATPTYVRQLAKKKINYESHSKNSGRSRRSRRRLSKTKSRA